MGKDDTVYLGDMLDMAQMAISKVKSINRRDFDEDENLRLAILHLIQIIGEAALKISPNTRNAYHNIP